ncbi:MAG: hypothetical protein JZD41_09430 [Thermoproteus sp.]|nr:hypothetical protein [Thermoproteus sp.]
MRLILGFYRFFLERGGFLLFFALAAASWAKGLLPVAAALLAGLAASWLAAWRLSQLRAVYCNVEGQRLTHISAHGDSASLRYGNAVFSVKGRENVMAAFECVGHKAPRLLEAAYKFAEPKYVDADLRGACAYAYLLGNNKDLDLYICEGGVDIGLSLRGDCPVILAAPKILEDLGATIIKRTYGGALFASAFFRSIEDATRFMYGLADFCRPGKACEGLTPRECLALYRLLFS